MNERTPGRESKGFLDGDLIESFLDLRRDKMEEVCVLGHKSEEVDALMWEKIGRVAEAVSI
jgi:hypothetical protein